MKMNELINLEKYNVDNLMNRKFNHPILNSKHTIREGTSGMQMIQTENKWRAVNNRKTDKRSRSTRFGTFKVAENEKEKGFAGQEKRAWFFISRVKNHVTEKMIESYIKQKSGYEQEIVKIKGLKFEKKR